MSQAFKSAGFIAFTADGGRRVVLEGDALRPAELAAREARDAGKVGKGKESEPIIGGMVYCTWREPSLVMRFRCAAAGKSGK